MSENEKPRRRWRRAVWPSLAIAAGVTLIILDDHLEVERRQRAAQAAFDQGKSLGRVLGMCDLLKVVVARNPAAIGGVTPEVRESLADCKRAEAEHAPGTTETVTVPK